MYGRNKINCNNLYCPNRENYLNNTKIKFKCSGCNKATYCSEECHNDDWKFIHHKLCNNFIGVKYDSLKKRFVGEKVLSSFGPNVTLDEYMLEYILPIIKSDPYAAWLSINHLIETDEVSDIIATIFVAIKELNSQYKKESDKIITLSFDENDVKNYIFMDKNGFMEELIASLNFENGNVFKFNKITNVVKNDYSFSQNPKEIIYYTQPIILLRKKTTNLRANEYILTDDEIKKNYEQYKKTIDKSDPNKLSKFISDTLGSKNVEGYKFQSIDDLLKKYSFIISENFTNKSYQSQNGRLDYIFDDVNDKIKSNNEKEEEEVDDLNEIISLNHSRFYKMLYKTIKKAIEADGNIYINNGITMSTNFMIFYAWTNPEFQLIINKISNINNNKIFNNFMSSVQNYIDENNSLILPTDIDHVLYKQIRRKNTPFKDLYDFNFFDDLKIFLFENIGKNKIANSRLEYIFKLSASFFIAFVLPEKKTPYENEWELFKYSNFITDLCSGNLPYLSPFIPNNKYIYQNDLNFLNHGKFKLLFDRIYNEYYFDVIIEYGKPKSLGYNFEQFTATFNSPILHYEEAFGLFTNIIGRDSITKIYNNVKENIHYFKSAIFSKTLFSNVSRKITMLHVLNGVTSIKFNLCNINNLQQFFQEISFHYTNLLPLSNINIKLNELLENVKNIQQKENVEDVEGFKDIPKVKNLLEKKRSLLTGLYPKTKYMSNYINFDRFVKRLRELEFSECSLIEFPKYLEIYKSLEKLNLSKNNIKTLPKSIRNYKSLIELNLSNNNITELNENISILNNLKTLILSMNNLKVIGTYISKLKSLETLKIINNNNKLPLITNDITKIKTLKSLDLAFENIPALYKTGSEIPKVIFKLTQLTSLNLQSHNISVIPADISNLKNIEKLGLHNNNITQLPNELSNLNSLIGIDITNNKLTTLPSTFGTTQNQLVNLYLQKNEIEFLEIDYSNMTNLKVLDLAYNKINNLRKRDIRDEKTNIVIDTIKAPHNINLLKNLRQLFLEHNNLNELPEDIGDLENLLHLSLSNNKLTTLSKSSFGKTNFIDLQNLITLNVSNNQLVKLPTNIGNLIKLRELNVAGNNISTLPNSFFELKQLRNLNLSRNKLKIISARFGNLQNMINVYLSNNQLVKIEIDIIHLPKLQQIDLTGNPNSSYVSGILTNELNVRKNEGWVPESFA